MQLINFFNFSASSILMILTMQKDLRKLQEKLETTNPTSHLSFFQPANTDEELASIIQNIAVSIEETIN